MDNCPCGSARPYAECCRSVIAGQQRAESADQVMRSRYDGHMRHEDSFGNRGDLGPGDVQ